MIPRNKQPSWKLPQNTMEYLGDTWRRITIGFVLALWNLFARFVTSGTEWVFVTSMINAVVFDKSTWRMRTCHRLLQTPPATRKDLFCVSLTSNPDLIRRYVVRRATGMELFVVVCGHFHFLFPIWRRHCLCTAHLCGRESTFKITISAPTPCEGWKPVFSEIVIYKGM